MFMFSLVENEQCFITSGPGKQDGLCPANSAPSCKLLYSATYKTSDYDHERPQSRITAQPMTH